jgi:hypothetical protein
MGKQAITEKPVGGFSGEGHGFLDADEGIDKSAARYEKKEEITEIFSIHKGRVYKNKACSGNYSKLFQRVTPPAALQAEAGALQPEK